MNAIGALTLVFAFRYGKAIIVAPLTNAGAPLATAIIALIAVGVMPGMLKLLGLVLALVASVLLAIEPDAADETAEAETHLWQRNFHYASFSCVCVFRNDISDDDAEV